MIESINRYPVIQQNNLRSNFCAATTPVAEKKDSVELSTQRRNPRRREENFWEKNMAAIVGITSIAFVSILLIGLAKGAKGGSVFNNGRLLEQKAPNPDGLLQKFVRDEFSPKSFDDVIGMDEEKKMFKRFILNRVKDPKMREIYKKKYKLDLPSGILLEGLPGNGKTFLVEALAGELNTDLYKLNMSELGSKYIHETGENIAKAIAGIKEKAKKSEKPIILFLDELDGVARARTGDAKSHELEELNTILQNINNLHHHNILLVGATNRKDLIDPATLRNGRFGKHIFVDNPNEKARKTLLTRFLEGIDYKLDNKEITEIVENTSGMSNAEIKGIVEDSSALAAEDNIADVSKKHFIKAIDDFKKSHKLTAEQKARQNIINDLAKDKDTVNAKATAEAEEEMENNLFEDIFDSISGLFGKKNVEKAKQVLENPKSENFFENMQEFMNALLGKENAGKLLNNLEETAVGGTKGTESDLEKLISKRSTAKIDEKEISKNIQKQVENLIENTKTSKEKTLEETTLNARISEAKNIDTKSTTQLSQESIDLKQNLDKKLKEAIAKIKNLTLENVLPEKRDAKKEELIDELLKEYNNKLQQLEPLDKNPPPIKD